jgi:hypothetical protein
MFTTVSESRRIFYAVTCLCSFALALCGTGQAQVFSPPMNVSSAASGNASYPAMVIDTTGSIDLAWIDSTSGINFTQLNTAGQVLLPAPIVIANSVGAAFQPQMVADPTGTIFEIAWAKPSATQTGQTTTYDVFVSRLLITAQAQGFTTVQVSPAADPPLLVDGPRLAFAGAGVDVVWGNTATWISQSGDGIHFGAPILLSIAAQDSGGPRIAVDNSGNIFVAWTDKLAEDRMTPGNYCTFPTGTPDPNGVINMYTNGSGGNYYLNFTPGGANAFPSAANTRSLSSSDWINKDPAYPNGYFGCSYDNLQLFFDPQDKLHLIWADEAPLEDLLTSAATTAPPYQGGSPTFSFPVGPSGGEGAGAPSVATDANGIVYIVYPSGPNASSATQGIYFNRSDPGTATKFNGSPTFVLPESSVVSAPGALSPAYPVVAVDSNGDVNVVWEQQDLPTTPTGSNTFHLFFARSTDKGATFPTIRPVVPLSSNPSAFCIPPAPGCGTVQMALNANSDPDLAWVNNPGSAANIDFTSANLAGPPPPADFSISVTSPTTPAYSGQTISYTVSAHATSDFTGSITLGCDNFYDISGVNGSTVSRSDYTCTAAPLNAGSSTTLNLAIPAQLPLGTYPFAIDGTSAGTTHRVMLSFTTAGRPGSISPGSADIPVGGSSQFSVTLNPGPFTGTVNFQCVGQPAWIKCGFNPSSVTASTAAVSTTLTVTVTSAPSGSMLTHAWPINPLRIQQLDAVWTTVSGLLYLLIVVAMWIWQRDRLRASVLLRRSAVLALVLVFSIGLVSCTGGTAAPSTGNATTVANAGGSAGSGSTSGSGSTGGSGGSTGSGGSGGGGSSTPVSAVFSIQATGNTTATLGTVSITTP